MKQKALLQNLGILFFLLFFPALSHANPSGVGMVAEPTSAKNGDLVTVYVSMTGASENMYITAENLDLIRGYHDHCGYCDTPCLDGDDIRVCADFCYGEEWSGIGCEYSNSNEMSPTWFGPPTLEYRVNGCGIGKVMLSYLDGNHGGPYDLEPLEIAIEDGIEADFAYSSPVCAGEEVSFENRSCGGDTFSWNFGDGGSSSEENPVHKYNSAGTFSVSLTASTKHDSDKKTKEIEVRNDCATIKGTASEASPDGATLPGVTVTAQSSPAITTTTGVSGNYRMTVESDVVYNLLAEKRGYEPEIGPTVTLSANEEYTWDLALKPVDETTVDPLSLGGKNLRNVEDPVNPATGNYYYTEPLFNFPGRRGMGVLFSVNYNSALHLEDGPLGYGWSHSYNISVSEDADVATVVFGDGRRDFFQWDNVAGKYKAINCHSSIVLTRNDPEGWQANVGGSYYYHFDSQGRLIQVADLNSNSITFSYSADGIDEITDSQNRTISFFYDSGRLARITSPITGQSGNTSAFSYDASGNLIAIADARGNSLTYTYDAEHRLLTETDRSGSLLLTNTYDSAGRVTSQEDAVGGTTAFMYTDTPEGPQVKITIPNQLSYIHQYDKNYNLLKIVDTTGLAARFAPGSNGRPSSIVDKNEHSLSFESNELGLLTLFSDHFGQDTTMTYNDHLQITQLHDDYGRHYTFGYDGNGNLISSSNSTNDYVKYWVNGDGQTYRISYPAYGGIWEIGYDSLGLVSTVKDRYDKTTTYHHDVAGRVTQIDYPESLGSATAGFDANGNLLWKQTPEGYRMEYTYDANNRKHTRTFAPTGAVTTYDYDAAGRLATITGSRGGVWRYSYDALNNIIAIEDADGVISNYEYNDRNQLKRIIRPSGNTSTVGYDSNGNKSWVRNQYSSIFSRSYDDAGRVTSMKDALGNTWRYTRDPIDTDIKSYDPLGRRTRVSFDTEGFIKRSESPDGSAISFQRNPGGMLTGLVDEENNRWQYLYDYRGRLQKSIAPDGMTETYEYDAVGNLLSLTGKDGEEISWTYDLDSRVSAISLPGGNTANWTYAYDDTAGTLTVEMSEPLGTTSSVYDSEGRITSSIDAYGNAIGYSYTAAGRASSLIYPGNLTVNYLYDTFGRLHQIEDSKGNTTTYGYDQMDRVTEISFPNGTSAHYQHDKLNRITAIEFQKSDGTVFEDLAYSRNTVGKITGVSRTEAPAVVADASTTSFTYDAMNRIQTSTKGTIVTTFHFDDKGNCTSSETGGATTTYSYDDLNRMKGVTDGTDTTTYTYDLKGERLAKVYNGTERRYLRNGRKIYAILDAANIPLSYQVYAGPLLYTITAAEDLYVYHADLQGNIIAVTDGDGNLVKSLDYDPYGNVIGSSGTLDTPFGYLGAHGVLTDENNLLHMQARYYSPMLGRFLTEDPIGTSAGPNLYMYVGGNPINRIDPSGLMYLPDEAALPPDIDVAGEASPLETAPYETMNKNLHVDITRCNFRGQQCRDSWEVWDGTPPEKTMQYIKNLEEEIAYMEKAMTRATVDSRAIDTVPYVMDPPSMRDLPNLGMQWSEADDNDAGSGGVEVYGMEAGDSYKLNGADFRGFVPLQKGMTRDSITVMKDEEKHEEGQRSGAPSEILANIEHDLTDEKTRKTIELCGGPSAYIMMNEPSRFSRYQDALQGKKDGLVEEKANLRKYNQWKEAHPRGR